MPTLEAVERQIRENSLFFSLLPGNSPRWRPVSQDCVHHQPRPRPGPLSGAGDFGRLFAELSQAGVEFQSDHGVIWPLAGGTGPRSLAAIFQFPRPSAGALAETEFETPERGSKRGRVAAKRAGGELRSNCRRVPPVVSPGEAALGESRFPRFR